MTAERLAEAINKDCEEYRYFWAIGLIKETLGLWRQSRYYKLLNQWARIFADHYIEEDE